MARDLLSLMLLLAAPVSAQDAGTAPPCACLNRDGEKVPLGQVACLTVGGRSFLARCDMSLNLLTWRKLSEGCPLTQLPPLTAGPGLDRPG